MSTEATWANAIRACKNAREALEPFANNGFLFTDMTLYHLRELIRRCEEFKHPDRNTRAVNLPKEPADLPNASVQAPGSMAQASQDNQNSTYPQIARLTLEDGTVLLTAEAITESSQLPAVKAHLRTLSYITIDCEFMTLQKKEVPSLKVVQIGTSPTHGYAFIVPKLGMRDFCATIEPLFTAPNLRRTGFALTNDAHVIKKCLGIELGRTLDLQTKLSGISLIRAMEEQCISWAGYAEFLRIKQKTVDFTHQKGRMIWDRDPLPDDALLYAVFDAVCLFHLEAAVEERETQPNHYWPSYATDEYRKKKKLLGRKKRSMMTQETSGDEDWYSDDEGLEQMMPTGQYVENLSEKGEAKDEGLRSDLNFSNEPPMPTRMPPRQPTSPSTAKPEPKPKITPPNGNRVGKSPTDPSLDVVSVSWDALVATSSNLWAQGIDVLPEHLSALNTARPDTAELGESEEPANAPMNDWDWGRGNPTGQPNHSVGNGMAKGRKDKADPVKDADWAAPQSPIEDSNNDNPRWQTHTPDPRHRNGRQSSDRHYAEADGMTERGNFVINRGATAAAPQTHDPKNRNSNLKHSQGKNGRSSSISSSSSSVLTPDHIDIKLKDGTKIIFSMISSVAGLAVLEPFLEDNSLCPIIINSQYVLRKNTFPDLKLLQLLIHESPTQYRAFTILHKDLKTNLLDRTVLYTLLTSPSVRRASWSFDLHAQAIFGALGIMPGKTLDLQGLSVIDNINEYQFDEALKKYASGWVGLNELQRARDDVRRKGKRLWDEKIPREAQKMNALEALAILKVAEGADFNVGLGRIGTRKPRGEDFWFPNLDDDDEDFESSGDNN